MCVSTPLPLCCKREWSCHQSFLLRHSVVPCCTSLYCTGTPGRNYADRQIRRVLVLLEDVEGGVLLYAGLEPQEEYQCALQSLFIALEREIDPFSHIFHV